MHFKIVGSRAGRQFSDTPEIGWSTEAKRSISSMATVAVEQAEGGDWQLEVTDAAGDPVGSLRFSVTRP